MPVPTLTIEGPVGFEAWGVSPAVAGGMERLGWRADEAPVREIMPPVIRGNNVVAVLPPCPAWAGPVAGALLAGLEARGGRVLLLSSPAQVAEWGALLAALAKDTTLSIEAARGPARAARTLAGGKLDVLVASPETALALQTRSALAPERFTAVLFAWPEEWDADDAVTAVLQDVPKDAQRIVVTSQAERLEGGEGIIERYARKALVFGGASPLMRPELALPVGPVRTLATSWGGRAQTIASIIEATDPIALTVWTADARDHGLLRRTLAGSGAGVSVATRSTPVGGSIVCYDLPSRDALRGLVAAGDVILLVPPGCERYVTTTAAPRRPMQVESAVAAQADRDARFRAEIVKTIAAEPQSSALYALAPLFEIHEPQMVAAALFTLWRAAQERATAVAATAGAGRAATPASGAATAQLWVGVGKKDEATVGDMVAVLVKEVGLDRTLIGKIEMRDTFCLVEVPAGEAERIAQGLTGKTIRRRKLSARIDSGQSPSPRGGKTPFKVRAPR